MEQAHKFYNGKLTIINDIQGQCDSEKILEKEKKLLEIYPFGDEVGDLNGENNFAVLDDVNTLKNLMAFAEITRYRETLLVDMTQEERDEVTKKIISNLDKFDVKPIGYEIKEDSIVIAWYLNSVINTFYFSCQVTGLVDYYTERGEL